MNNKVYEQLDPNKLENYLYSIPSVNDYLEIKRGVLVEEIGDGNLNFVYKVVSKINKNKAVIVKQSVPYLRMAGEAWPLSKSRMRYEIRALKLYNELVPEFVPKVHHSDEDMSVIVMQYLDSQSVLRYGMMKGEYYPDISKKIGTFLAQTLFETSFLGMESMQRRALMSQFVLNDELCKLTEDFIFTFPYMNHESNSINPITEKYVENSLRNDSEYKLSILRHKEMFLTKTDALVHGDLHTGSLMVSKDDAYVIDTEFAFFGPFGFDLGKIVANFLLNYISHFNTGNKEYQEWVLCQSMAIFKEFEKQFLTKWDEQDESSLLTHGYCNKEELDTYKKDMMVKIFQDSIGFCACSLARRSIGIAGVADIRSIADIETRAALEIKALRLSKLLMSKQSSLNKVDELEEVIRNYFAGKEYPENEVHQ